MSGLTVTSRGNSSESMCDLLPFPFSNRRLIYLAPVGVGRTLHIESLSILSGLWDVAISVVACIQHQILRFAVFLYEKPDL